MKVADRIESIEAFALQIPRDEPYLGPLEEGVRVTEKGTFVRPGNRTIYSVHDHCVLVKAVTESGVCGWGECVAVVTPRTVKTLIEDLIGPLVIGRDPERAEAIHEEFYDAMRVRGFFGGFYLDALAAVDIALWDLRGKLRGAPVCDLMGGARRERLPAYASGLPGKTREERAKLAEIWAAKGFRAVKFAAAVAHDGAEREMAAVREAVGPDVQILADLHWRHTASEAIRLISKLERYDLALAEAPVAPEDVEGLAQVARSVRTSVAAGEELRTVHEYRPRFLRRCMDVIQPEMGRTGLSGFRRIGEMAGAFHCRLMPHASIGIGIYQAASLHASAVLPAFAMHEYQHSIFDRNLRFVEGRMACEAGFFHLPEGPGLGVSPREDALGFAMN